MFLRVVWAVDPSIQAWPRFRGPGGSGVNPASEMPVHFGPNSNVVWQTELPGGNSSLCIWGNRIFLTAQTPEGVETVCVERITGKILWQRSLATASSERGAGGNLASSTPVTEGKRVYVYFGCVGLIAYTFDGQEIWRKPLPNPVTQHGVGTSPVLAGNRLLLNVDQDSGSYLLLVGSQSGETIWKIERPGFRRGFGTPALWPPDRPSLAIVAGTLRAVGYDLKKGSEVWSQGGLPNELVASPVVGEGMIFVGGWTPGAGVSTLPTFDSLLEAGDRDKDGRLSRDEAPPGPARQHFLYIDANKDGFVTREEWESLASIFRQSENALLALRPSAGGREVKVQWKYTHGLPYVPTPLYYGGRVYLVKNGGLVTCLSADSGKELYREERVGALGDYYASPIAANGKVCLASQPGVVVILRAGDVLDVIARNNLEEPITATPAVLDDKLYVRTKGHLYAFREGGH